ncbi:MAG: hypothetical protein LW686_00080 [Ilumatobacteraceae bacterium]|jgi:hypothetical protein|nr:hypothetical protein [Ilumatobacteraceae bacterium]MCE2817039.1 hypothetical protein [Ilumatobacteraceae bacterium]
MTIRKGEEWGVRVMCPEEREIAEDDFDASRHDSSSVFSVIRGDLHLSLGSPKVPIIGHECTAVPIDALRCTVTAPSGEQRDLFAISSITLGSWWRGSFVVLSNSGFYNGLNIAPRSHPNDGECDVMVMERNLPFRQRVLARQKAKTGTHVPHPLISLRRSTEFSHSKQSPRERLVLDGRAVDNWVQLDVSVLPDYWTVLL